MPLNDTGEIPGLPHFHRRNGPYQSQGPPSVQRHPRPSAHKAGPTVAPPSARAPAPVSERQLPGTGPVWPPPTGLPGREGERPCVIGQGGNQYGAEELSFSHLNFAASRLRVNLWSRHDLPPSRPNARAVGPVLASVAAPPEGGGHEREPEARMPDGLPGATGTRPRRERPA